MRRDFEKLGGWGNGGLGEWDGVLQPFGEIGEIGLAPKFVAKAGKNITLVATK